jgi:hypothetical protein
MGNNDMVTLVGTLGISGLEGKDIYEDITLIGQSDMPCIAYQTWLRLLSFLMATFEKTRLLAVCKPPIVR